MKAATITIGLIAGMAAARTLTDDNARALKSYDSEKWGKKMQVDEKSAEDSQKDGRKRGQNRRGGKSRGRGGKGKWARKHKAKMMKMVKDILAIEDEADFEAAVEATREKIEGKFDGWCNKKMAWGQTFCEERTTAEECGQIMPHYTTKCMDGGQCKVDAMEGNLRCMRENDGLDSFKSCMGSSKIPMMECMTDVKVAFADATASFELPTDAEIKKAFHQAMKKKWSQKKNEGEGAAKARK